RRYVSRARRCSSSDRPSPSWYGVHPALHSFPTRRSSDLLPGQQQIVGAVAGGGEPLDEMLPEGGKAPGLAQVQPAEKGGEKLERDRKSTRLNSSHVSISYAVFCVKKKRSGERVSHGDTLA